MSTEIVRFHIVGLTPLLMHSPAGMKVADSGLAVKRIPSPEEEAKAGEVRDPEGTLSAKADWFRKGALYACAGKRLGKFAARTRLQATAWCTSVYSPVYNPVTKEQITEYRIDVQRTVLTSGRRKAAVMRARPEIWPWACDVAFELDTDMVKVADLAELLTLAGKVSGAGDFRPSSGGGSYGRYTATLY